MSAIDTLVGIHEQRLDEVRARVTRLEVERVALHTRTERLAAELAAEAETAAESYEAGQAYPAFAARVAERQAALAEEIAAIDAVIAEAREAVTATSRELKTYEISRDRARERERVEEARRERARLDEIGAVAHRRNRAG